MLSALSDQSAPGRVLFSGNFFVNNAIAGAIELPTLLGCVYLMRFGRKRYASLCYAINPELCVAFVTAIGVHILN